MEGSANYWRFLASALLSGGATQKHIDAAAELCARYGDAVEGNLTLIEFAEQGAPPPAGRVVQFKPRGRVPMPPRGRGAFEPEDCA